MTDIERRLADVVEALLLFYEAPYWTAAERAQWLRLTGQTEATTRVLADCARAALAAPR